MPSKTMLIIRVKPNDMEKIDEIIKDIKKIKTGEVREVRKEPIGFGIELIKAGILVPSEDETMPEKVIKEITKIKDVEEAEVEGMTLL
jgi:translation elongation factor EF-1beta